ncbi:MAG: DinB family protein [Saprospiraceae bacterium]|nr:DinB family protein [Saprospiraceae bacterium]
MLFSLAKSIEILQSTPSVLHDLVYNLSNEWTFENEGPDTWSVYDIIGHLIHGEKKDWIERLDIILSDSPNKEFTPFDRFAQFTESKGKSIKELLAEFETLRNRNLEYLKSKNLQTADFAKIGIHPKFGTVTLQQLLATWTVHDMNHLSQICRVMAKQLKEEVGPWVEYLRILKG